MSTHILFLEDEPGFRSYTAEWLQERGYNVISFSDIDMANKYFRENYDNIDCIITDLNMSDEWLENFQTESIGCLFSGWVWLQKFIYIKKPDMPTVIYSGFIRELKNYLKEVGDLPLLEKKDNIVCVEKGSGYDQGFKGLQNALERKLKIKGNQS